MVEGLRYVRGHPSIPGVLLITVTVNTLVFPYQTLLPVFARDILGQGPLGLGLLGAGGGIGSFFGLLAINRVRRFLSPGWIYAGGSTFLSVAVVAFAASTSYPLSVALLILAGVGHACFGVMQSTIVLTSSSDEMRDRAMGTLVLAIGGGPLGRLQIGALATALGSPLAVILTCATSALTVLGVTAAFPGLRKRKIEPDAP
jgi:predicted MFS family arabinose efflux permease